MCIRDRVYTDLALLTCNPAIASDVAMLFNALTGYAGDSHYRCLMVAPSGVRNGMLQRIDRVTAQHRQTGHGYIASVSYTHLTLPTSDLV